MKKAIIVLLVLFVTGCGEYLPITDNSSYSTVTVTSKITGEIIIIENVDYVWISSEKGFGKDGGTGIINISVALRSNGTFLIKETIRFSQDSYSFISIPNEIIVRKD